MELEISVDQLAVTPEECNQFKKHTSEDPELQELKGITQNIKTDGQRTKKKFHKTSENTGILEIKFPASMAFCTRTTS